MNIGINLVGVSYSETGRVRNFADSYDSFCDYIVSPLKNSGHSINYYVTTYENKKKEEIINLYNPESYTFLDEYYNRLGGGDLIEYDGRRMGIMFYTYLASLFQLKNKNLDLIISTRFDIKFKMNPFNNFHFDFDKFNFIFRDYIYTDYPLVCDTFYVFPYEMLDSLINAIIEAIDRPYNGLTIGMLNMYQPMINLVGNDRVNIACDEFLRSDYNYIFDLNRTE